MFSSNSENSFLKILLIYIFLISTAFSNRPKEILNSEFTESEFQYTKNTPEKVFLHFDKPYYSSGENMWFKVYLVNANTNRPNALSKMVHVDLIDPHNEIINSRIVKIEEGGGAGEFYLPIKLNSGEYTVRAYTNFMRNFDKAFFFRKKIYVTSLESPTVIANDSPIKTDIELNTDEVLIDLKPDIQFFPEGGYMIDGLPSRIGIKAIDRSGKAIDVSGTILDSKEEKIASFETLKFGMGIFRFKPQHGRSYKAIINFEGSYYSYELPTSLERGVNMMVNDQGNNYQIELQSSLPGGVDDLTLIGHQKGEIVCVADLSGAKMKGIINVPKSTLNQGIVQFIVFDGSKSPLCERLVFVDNKKTGSRIIMQASNKEFNKRELVEVEFSLDSSSQELFQSNTSVAVTDVSVVHADQYALDIRSHLLLNSELRGEIEEPGYYLYSDDPNKKKILDLLMMTQGWRQFLWNDVANDNKQDVKYSLETGISFKGIVQDYYDQNKPATPELSLTFQNDEEYGHDEVIPLDNGAFAFGDYQFTDSTSIIIQAKKYKINKKTNQKKINNPRMGFYIELDSLDTPEITINRTFAENIYRSNDNDYLERSKTVYHYDTINPYKGDFIELDEVKLAPVKTKEKKNYNGETFMYNDPSYRVDFDDIQMKFVGNPILALRGLVPGLTVTGARGEIINLGRGGNSLLSGIKDPLFLLNSMIVHKEVILSLSIAEVSWIDILKGYKAAIWGSRAAYGVIAVYTKNGKERALALADRERKGIINFVHPGYYKARKFYEPVYKTEKPEHKYPDYRSTIYWNPTLKLNETGKSKISFYTADVSTRYLIELQGITSDGLPIKNEIYVDVK